VNFICIGCAGLDLAGRYIKELQLKSCMVGYVKSEQDNPRWGQLGCNGFIVLDGQRRVVSKATTAFLEMNTLAFVHVEALLDALLVGAEVPDVCPGECVVLAGVQNKRQRGMQGVVVEAADPSDGRCSVFVLSQSGGSMVRVVPEKLRVLPPGALQLPPRHLQFVKEAREMAVAATTKRLQKPGDADQQDRQSRADCDAQMPDAAVEKEPQQPTQSSEAAEDLASGPVTVESVLNSELDVQHEDCAAALDALVRQRTASALEAALQTMRRHFDFEEELLDKHLYANLTSQATGHAVGGFNADESMRRTHWSDHKRILATMEDHLVELGDDACGKSSGCALPVQRLLSSQFVKSLVVDFKKHADKYDTPYASRLAAALAAQ